ncbi:pyridoxal phosphate-dependent aminotransferase [Niabella aurantiaca]|uniref:pyridoxal phosphate-dependent aminotransferase n=1 Tax=Niabella aurantiaca TaxID=379900 RepID=UPI000374DB3A|nr:aminotransferase class I/II-fold pyridoxal phosphate-dependent enzyme [Niabella aurantiaca]
MKLSQLAESIPGSAILALGNAVKERIRKGEKIYNHTVGDFDPAIFPIPALLEEEIISAYKNRQTNYPLAEGNADLKETLSAFIRDFQGLHYPASDILVAAGGRPLIYAAYQVIVDPGDKVIYPVPSWNNNYYVQLTKGKHCVIETAPENHFMPLAEEIAPHIKDAVLLALCAPQNPTGTCYSTEQLKAVCRLVVAENERRGADEKKLCILYDQIYHLLAYQDAAPADPVMVCPEVRPYCIYIDAVSKGFAATGVRVGWCYGPAPVIAKMKAILSHVGAWAPMAEQKAVAAFLRNTDAVKSFLGHFKSRIFDRLQQICKAIRAFKEAGLPVDAIAPQASIYLTVKIDLPGDASVALLNGAGIALLPFSAFGATKSEKWYRLSVGTCRKEAIGPMLQELKNVLEKSREPVHGSQGRGGPYGSLEHSPQ